MSLVIRWIEHGYNRDIIIAFWDGGIDADEAMNRQQKLTP